jgi:hypothetical protein
LFSLRAWLGEQFLRKINLCHSTDPVALWLAASMRQLGLEVAVVTVEQLVSAVASCFG